MEDSSWPLHAQPGIILSLTATLVIAIVRGDTIVTEGTSKGLEKLLTQLCQKKGENFFDSESSYVVERGCGLFVPCGTVAFVFGLHEGRITKQTAVDVSFSKRRKKKPQLELASHVWVPRNSEKNATNTDAKVIAWTFAQLTISKVQLIKKVYGNQRFRDMDGDFVKGCDNSVVGG